MDSEEKLVFDQIKAAGNMGEFPELELSCLLMLRADRAALYQ